MLANFQSNACPNIFYSYFLEDNLSGWWSGIFLGCILHSKHEIDGSLIQELQNGGPFCIFSKQWLNENKQWK